MCKGAEMASLCALGVYISYFTHCCDTMPERNNLKEEDLFWLRVSEGSAPAFEYNIMVVRSHRQGVSLPHGQQELELEEGTKIQCEPLEHSISHVFQG